MAEVIENDRQWKAMFADVADDFRRIKWKRFLDRALGVIEEEHGVMFAAQHEIRGTPWAPLSHETIERKGHDRILFETDRLRGSLIRRNHPDAIRQMFDDWPDHAGLMFGTEVPYAIFHETGTEIMPARRHIGMSERTVDTLANLAADHAVAELAK